MALTSQALDHDQRSNGLGITNADYQGVDAQAMDFDDASFDGIICRWGFMLMRDPAAAFGECRRVLAPGGRLVFAVFTGPDENPFASIPARILMDAGHLPPPGSEWRPGILALADRARVVALLTGAGFRMIHVEGVNMTWTFANADEYWTFLADLTALGPLVRSLPDTVRDAVRSAINQRLASFTRADGIALPSRCWGGLAIR